MISSLRRLWRGELPLSTAFWVYVCAYGLLVNLVFTGIALVLYLNFDLAVPALVAHLAPLAYFLVAAVGTWRSADRYTGPPLSAYLAKLGIILVFGIMLVI